MSMLDSFQKIFGSAPAPAPVAPTNNPATNPAPAAPASSQGTAPNGVVPADGNTPGDKSPTEAYKTLWDPIKTEEGQQEQQSSGLTPEKMLEAASKVDFRKVLDPESLAKIKNGGDDAVAALADLLNKQGQTVYGQSLVVAQKLVEKAVSDAEAKFSKQIPDFVRGQSAREALISQNSAFKDPAVAPVVAAIQSQLQLKYPTATASELAQMAQDYFKTAASVLTSDPKAAKAAAEKQAAAAGDDWEAWIQTSPTSS
jgi:hypothetical protein